VSGRVLEQRGDRTAVLDLMGFFDWLGDKNMAIIRRSLPHLPCEVGCCYCCYVGPHSPDLLPPEVFRVAAYLRNEESASLPMVRTRLKEVDGPKEEGETKTPCLFLSHDRCLIYPVRPLRCRAQYSPDAEACELSYLGQRETMPLLGEPALLYKSIQIGIRLGLNQVGMQSSRLTLRKAIAIALREADAFERWLDGELVFEHNSFADETGEEHLVAQFARRAKHQVRAEGKRMQRAITVLLEQPGTWALYSTRGVEPRS
jgi:hypothetical protein